MPIQTEILTYYKATNVQYNLFYALDGFLNIILCPFAGSLIHENKLGLNRSMILSCSFIVLGNLLLAVSSIKGTFFLALFGRVIAGCGLEC
jgi:dipeptide/tripeptide permease